MWKISAVFILVVASATFFITSSSYQNTGTKTAQRTFFDHTGKLHVMGIVLGESTLRDAEKSFRSRADYAIFLYPKPNQESEDKKFSGELEAYFPSIADHSKVMLKMEVSPEMLETMRQRASKPRIYPNGVVRMNLSSEDILNVRKMIVRELTLIPSVQIDTHIMQIQFGQPTSSHTLDQHTTLYTFPNIGLRLTINQEGKDKLVFSNL